MKSPILVIITIVFLNIISGAQPIKSIRESHSEKGSFICRLNDNIIYSFTDDEGEYPVYKLYSVNTINGNKILIDSLVTLNCWRKVSDTTLLFSISNKLYAWNSNTNTKEAFLHSIVFTHIIAIDFNQNFQRLAVFDFDHENDILLLKVFDATNKNIFNKKIELNTMELEGILPKIESAKESFVFTVQDHLYVLNLNNLTPVLELISDKCDGFSLKGTNSVLFYKFISDERTTGYLTNLETLVTETIDKKLDEKVYNCSKSNLFSAMIKNEFVPVYHICDDFYMFSGFSWVVNSDLIFYMDEKLTVKYPIKAGGLVDENCFEWIIQD